MKKLLLLLLVFISTISFCYAAEEIVLDLPSNNLKLAIIEQQVEALGETEKQDMSKESLKDLHQVQVSDYENSEEMIQSPVVSAPILQGVTNFFSAKAERTDTTTSLFKKYTTKEFESGPFEKLYLWGAYQGNFDTLIPKGGNGYFLYDPALINIFLDGKFRGGKEGFRIMADPTPQNNRPFMRQFIQDAYFYTKRVPNHTVMVGNSRVGIGDEGRSSSFVLPLVNRAQISRNLSNVRKFGVRVKGNYKLVDYDIGGYSSDTFFREFFPGTEFTGWVNFKPLGMTDGRYGKLTTGGGISSGHNNIHYFLSGVYLGYEYKRFWTKFEYMDSNGSNSQVGPSTLRANGWFGTMGYKITPKLEVVARYDSYDPNKNVKNDRTNEYTAGLTYYLKGQALRLMLNYVYCQNQTIKDSHRIIVGTQIIL